MLQIKDLCISMKKDLRPLLSGFSFALNPGDRVAVIGEEGDGKSTLLHMRTKTPRNGRKPTEKRRAISPIPGKTQPRVCPGALPMPGLMSLFQHLFNSVPLIL